MPPMEEIVDVEEREGMEEVSPPAEKDDVEGVKEVDVVYVEMYLVRVPTLTISSGSVISGSTATTWPLL